MKLLNVDTYKLETFPRHVPEYAILSHTWENDEVLFGHIVQGVATARSHKGWGKVEKCCQRARQDGWEWVWIDTCCIDKSSSAELSEAINSMFKWYQDAEICYAYLEDVGATDVETDFNTQFVNARWFTRGWTLQELLAPETVLFFNGNWVEIGTKVSRARLIMDATTIDNKCLEDSQAFRHRSIAKRFSWAARRVTTREEDAAYCLLGIFDVNMPLLYGEGNKAFHRLQLEILKESQDQSLFAWTHSSDIPHRGPLAPLPRCFLESGTTIGDAAISQYVRSYGITNAGLNISLLLSEMMISDPVLGYPTRPLRHQVAILNCMDEQQDQYWVWVLRLMSDSSAEDTEQFVRYNPDIGYQAEKLRPGYFRVREVSGTFVGTYFCRQVDLLIRA